MLSTRCPLPFDAQFRNKPPSEKAKRWCPKIAVNEGGLGILLGLLQVPFEETRAERIRCWVHNKNVLEKVPDDQHDEIKRLLVDVRDAPNHPAGEQRAAALITELERRGIHAAACLLDDLAACLAHLKLPARHRRTVRMTNLCERSFVEQRRRAKVIPRFRGEREYLKLVFASLWRASERWNNVEFTKLERAEWERYFRARKADGFEVPSLTTAALLRNPSHKTQVHDGSKSIESAPGGAKQRKQVNPRAVGYCTI